MEAILIKNDRMKISLSKSEMAKYGLDCENRSLSDSGRAIRKILDDAKIKTGFDISNGRLLVELFGSAKSGCELFVSKKSSRSFKRTAKKTAKRAFKITDRAAENQPEKQPKKAEAFALVFSTLNGLLCACAALLPFKEEEKTCSAFAFEDGSCYILLCEKGMAEALSDYSEKAVACDRLFVSFIKEHGRKISGNAAKDLAPLG